MGLSIFFDLGKWMAISPLCKFSEPYDLQGIALTGEAGNERQQQTRLLVSADLLTVLNHSDLACTKQRDSARGNIMMSS